jgi:hypothetical protein
MQLEETVRTFKGVNDKSVSAFTSDDMKAYGEWK